MLPVVLRLLTPSVVRGIMDYVFKKNDLDYKMEKLIERVEELETRTESLKEKKWINWQVF